jgi:serine/threonine protein kinase
VNRPVERQGVPGTELVAELGRGARTVVYRARRAGRDYAVKFLRTPDGEAIAGADPADPADPVGEAAAFRREAVLLARLEHPGLARVHEVGEVGGRPYLIMDLIEGRTASDVLAAGPLPEPAALRLATEVAAALAVAHRAGVVHRDLKPDNIMLREDGTLVLADFGIAKDMSRPLSQTRHGEALATPFYLSPEQALSGKVDQRSDLYSLGVMFYEMLTGRKPYTAEDAPALLHKHVHEAVPQLPVDLALFQPLLERLMAKQPEERFPGSPEALQAIRALMPA